MDEIRLVPMTQEQFEAWLPGTIESYAAENVSSGRWSEHDAVQKSREEHERLLPQGVATTNHHLWTVVRSSDQQRVGLVWMAVVEQPSPHAFIYNIEIDERFRRRGYAEQAMLRLEDEARRLGLDTIRLHVFGHNTAARPLYEKLGYATTNVLMAKTLATTPPSIPNDMLAFNRKLIGEYRASGGRLSGQLAGSKLMLLTTTGRRSGRAQTAVIGYRTSGDGYVAIASGNGAPAHPAWYLNLLAEPEATIEVGAATLRVRARTAGPNERAELAKLIDYLERQQALTEREIPIVVFSRI